MLFGDVSKEDKKLAQELIEFENKINKESKQYQASELAKMYLCIAHDWYVLGEEDKGAEILEKIVIVCPTYFDNEIKNQIENDPSFCFLVENLTKEILIVATSILGGKNAR